jgi:RNA polymerase sigma-70 factor (family 1)
MYTPENHNKLDEQELASLFSAGNDLVFTEIYNRYWNKLLAIAYNHTKDKSAAEEIVQEVFVSLWSKRDIIHVQSLSRYLAKAVKFLVFKQIHRRKRQIELQQNNYLPGTVEIGDDVIEAKFLQDYINRIVDELPEKCRLVFKYSRQAGMSIPEIAALMDISEKTVESHLTKALKTLRVGLVRYRLLLILMGV